jgi:hypothetical protein
VGALFAGFSVVYVLNTQLQNDKDTKTTGTVFAVFVQFLLFGWWYALNSWVWQKKAVDSASLLSLKAPVLSPGQMATYISTASIAVGGGFLVFVILDRLGVIVSMSLWTFGTLYLIAPAPVPFQCARYKFLGAMIDIVKASLGLVKVEFWHTYITDGLTSACVLLFEIEYSACCFSLPDTWANSIENTAGLYCNAHCGPGSHNQQVSRCN